MSTLHADPHATEIRPARNSERPVARALDIGALVLLIVGGLNWGLVGLFQFDLVATLFGEMTTMARVVYALVGAAALYGIVTVAHLLRRDA